MRRSQPSHRPCSAQRLWRLPLLLALLGLAACSEPLPESAPLTIDLSPPLGGVQTTGTAQKISDSYPYLSRVSLQIIAHGYTTRAINDEFNNGQFTMDAEFDALLIDESRTTLNVPPVDMSLLLSAYNTDGYRIYSASSNLSAAQLSAAGSAVALAMQVDIDPAVPRYANDPGCPGDADGDGYCDLYEDIFVTAAGSADIDADGSPNSQDPDSDGDGTPDSAELDIASNDGYPAFIHANQAPSALSLAITTAAGTPSAPTAPQVSDPDIGDTFSFTIASAPSYGSATVDSGGLVTYTPVPGFAGSDSFTLTATDYGGLSISASATVTVTGNANFPPTATAQALATDEDSPLAITLSGSDADGDPLTYSVSAGPANGSLSGTAPNLSYTPNADYNGSDSFSFTVNDGTIDSAAASVSITVNPINDPPIARPDGARALENISLDSTQLQANDHSYAPATNDNGRFVAFWSAADNLVAGDNNNAFDLFLRDTLNGSTERLNVDDSGIEANSGAPSSAALHAPALSLDGRYVAFDSNADNLYGLDSGGFIDVFVRDRLLQTTTLVTACEGTGNGDSYDPAISPDGSHLVFTSEATDPWPGCFSPNDLNGVSDIYMESSTYGNLRVSLDAAGLEANGASFAPSLSDDGSYVAFTSAATNLIASDSNGLDDIFVKNLSSAAITRVSVDSSGAQASGGHSDEASISADGRIVAFSSEAGNLVANDSNAVRDIFVHDTLSGQTTRVSVDSAGAEANGPSSAPFLSKDGRFVAFVSLADNLVGGDSNGVQDIFLHDRISARTERLSLDPNALPANGASLAPALSGIGQHLVFASAADNLSAGDANAMSDIIRLSLTDIATVDSLTVQTPDLTLNDSDVDGDLLSAQSPTTPNNGSVLDNTDNTFSYTPDPQFIGLDRFDYTLSDGSPATATATVTIAVQRANYPPQGAADDIITSSISPNTIIDVLANDFDLDGDSLSVFSAGSTTAANDNLSGFGNTLTINADNTITYSFVSTPPTFDWFYYIASDGSAQTSAIYVSITIN